MIVVVCCCCCVLLLCCCFVVVCCCVLLCVVVCCCVLDPPVLPCAGPPCGPPCAGPPHAGPLPFSLFLSLFGCLLVDFWCFRRSGHSNVPIWALGLSCETPAASGPPGLHTTTRELQTRTIEGSGASNTTKIPRKDPQRETKRAKVGGEREKSAKFWVPHPSGPHASGPIFLGLHLPS